MIGKLFKTQGSLMITGVISFALALITAGLIFVDPAEILGINRWIKPMKFFMSIGIFVWTLAVYLNYLPVGRSFLKKFSWFVIAVFIIEMAIICGQALRGTTSHFNNTTPLNQVLFTIMGAAIVALTVAVAYVAYLYFRNDIELPPAIVWGMRLGLLVFLFGSIAGGYMSTQMGHAVGVPDGGAGLPIVNWSTEGGDLRAAHFLGLHGMQAVPLFALLLERFRVNGSLALTVAFALVYSAVITAVFVQALLGRPLLAM